jgi:hypothetical protein
MNEEADALLHLMINFNLSFLSIHVNILFNIYMIYNYSFHFLHLSSFQLKTDIDLQSTSNMI